MWSLPKRVRLFSLCCGVVFLLACPVQGSNGKTLLTFSGNLVSAELRDTPLMLVFNELKEKKGLWCQGEEKLKETNVSASFHELPLSIFLARILSRFNYSLIYDHHDRLMGIFIAGKAGRRQTRPSSPGSIRRFFPHRKGSFSN